MVLGEGLDNLLVREVSVRLLLLALLEDQGQTNSAFLMGNSMMAK
jgi:hypothetical protein